MTNRAALQEPTASRLSETGTLVVCLLIPQMKKVCRHLLTGNVKNIRYTFYLKGKFGAKKAFFCVAFCKEIAIENVF